MMTIPRSSEDGGPALEPSGKILQDKEQIVVVICLMK
jgi:hypothetical protein